MTFGWVAASNRRMASLNDAIRIRYALVLAKVLQPRRDHERLQEAPFLGRVFKNVPGVRAVSPSLLAQISDRSQESIAPLGIDAVFNGDQYRSTVDVPLDRQNRSWANASTVRDQFLDRLAASSARSIQFHPERLRPR